MRHARAREPDAAGLTILAGIFAVAYVLYGLFRHWRFESSAYDLGIFDQVVWLLSRFEAPVSSITNHQNIFGDHFHPIIALWVPLYWVAPAPETLIVAQALLLAASIVPVLLFARDRLPRGGAYAVAIAYGLFWGLQSAMAFDVHEVAFAPLVIATAILAMDRRRWTAFWVCMAVLMVTKEDLIPLVGGFGLCLLVLREWRRGAMAITISVLSFAVVLGVIMPHFNGSGYAYASAFGSVLQQPWQLPVVLVTPIDKLRTVFLWFAPFVFVPLASPLALLVPPLAAERLLSDNPNHWGAAFHYSLPLAPILAMSAADGLARVGRLVASRRSNLAASRAVMGVSIASVILCALLPGQQPLWRLFTPGHYRAVPTQAAGVAALAAIPRDASVVAQSPIVPHLSHRRDIFMLDSSAPEAAYVVYSNALDPWPHATAEELAAVVAQRFGRGYAVLFERDGWAVLKRESARVANRTRP
ncbi:MAG TPA: DUF2079 domain-containing protein [Vicinamibacterales bacterium]|nr:DUF2079 domain-containing protein [Vicinamibacterales bacterium]